MNAEQWRQVSDLFRRALELAPAARAGFLDGACAGEVELRREVEAMLVADAQAGGFLESILQGGAELLGDEEIAQRRIGPYRLVRLLGRGGMGAVYLGERDDGEFRQRVAIKLIRPGMDSGEVLRRFREERQILAQLEHPNIARLLDGGSSADGAPYFVMELVEGEPIDRYSRRLRLGVEGRLALFLAVCDAVQVAHQNLVVHRDLKPSNILVTSAGVPKLLDFGIAKLLHPAGPREATAVEQRLLTPLYSSPEQLLGQVITTATDVYGLGLVLYELLSGQRPFASKEASVADLGRAVCEEEPPAPSVAAGEGRREAPRAGEQDEPGPRLGRRLRGDLDTIVLMALRKEPSRRYASAEQLAADLRRHLDGLPVLARRDTWLYRGVKFVRRQKWGVAAVLVLLLLGVAFLVNRAQQSSRLARERDRAELVSEFLVEIFEVSDPSTALGRTIPAREILDRGARRIREELLDEPQLRALLLQTMGTVYANLGLGDEAIEFLQEAVGALRSSADSSPVELGGALNALANALLDRGDLEAAEERAEEALALLGAARGEGSPEVATSLDILGKSRWWRGDYAAAERYHRRALELRGRHAGAMPQDLAESHNELALVLESRGETTEAEAHYRQALDQVRGTLSESHPYQITLRSNLGLFLAGTRRDHAAAEPYLREASEWARRVWGVEHPHFARTLDNLAFVHVATDDLKRAEALYSEALELRSRILAPDHPEIARSLVNLADLELAKGEFRRAETLAREALALHRRRGELHGDLPMIENNLAVALVQLGAYDEGRDLIERAMAAAIDRDHLAAAAVYRSNLGWLCYESGDLDAAERHYTQALETKRGLLGDADPDQAATLAGLALTLQDRGEYERAEAMSREALALYAGARGEEHSKTARQLADLAYLLHLRGRYDEARSRFVAALSRLRLRFPEGHPILAAALTHLGVHLTETGEAAAAEPLLREALALQRRFLPAGHLRVAESASALGACLLSLGHPGEAQSLIADSYGVLSARLPADHRLARRARQHVTELASRVGAAAGGDAMVPVPR